MKRLFDKVYFSSELLSDKILVGGNTQNLLKFLVADTISETQVQEVQVKFTQVGEGREALPIEVIPYITLTQDTDNEDIFSIDYTVSETENTKDITAKLKILDENGNTHYNFINNFEIKVD